MAAMAWLITTFSDPVWTSLQGHLEIRAAWQTTPEVDTEGAAVHLPMSGRPSCTSMKSWKGSNIPKYVNWVIFDINWDYWDKLWYRIWSIVLYLDLSSYLYIDYLSSICQYSKKILFQYPIFILEYSIFILYGSIVLYQYSIKMIPSGKPLHMENHHFQ